MIGFAAAYPELANTSALSEWVNGAFTFAPDGNPLVGPVGPARLLGGLRRDGGL